MEAVNADVEKEKLISEVSQLESQYMNFSNRNSIEKTELKIEIAELKKRHEKQIVDIVTANEQRIRELAAYIIVNGEMTDRVYDKIEEELGIAFIIKTKRENDIQLTDSEIDYLITKI